MQPEAGTGPARRVGLERLAGPAAVLVAGALLPLLVSPRGDFPINDDWVNALGVKALVERGVLAPPAYTASTVVLQLAWGALFTQAFGFSHSVLRASTLVLATLGALGFYYLLLELVDRFRAALGALLLLFSPLYIPLAYSFHGDVPFLCLALWAQLCYVRALRGPKQRTGWLVAGSVLAASAMLIRQLGLLLPLAAFGGLYLAGGWRRALAPRELLALFGPILPALLISEQLEAMRPPLREQPLAWTLSFWREQGAGLAVTLLRRYAELSALLGLLTLPAWLAVLAGRRPSAPLRAGPLWSALPVALIVAGFVARAVVLRQSWWGPYSSNVISTWGYFPFSNQGVVPPPLVESRPLLMLLSAASLVAASLVVVTAVEALWAGRQAPAAAVPVLFAALALGLTLAYHQFFDRYALALVPCALLLAVSALPSSGASRWVAVVGLALFAVWSLAWERDLLERRAALWQAGLNLVARGVPAEVIDGGYEWNGWFSGPGLFAESSRLESDGTGQRLHAMVIQEIYFKSSPYSLAYGTSRLAPGAQVLFSVPYGNSRSVLAVERAPYPRPAP